MIKTYLQQLADLSWREKGCLCYNVYQDSKDLCQFYYEDGWASDEAEQRHAKGAEFQPIFTVLDSMFEGGYITEPVLRARRVSS